MQRFFPARSCSTACLSFGIRCVSSQPSFNKVPTLDMSNITEDPANGFMARVAFKNRRVEFSHYPQLGPRKSDPADPMPQFDMNARLFYRPNRQEFLEMLAVTSGKTSEAIISTAYGANIALKKTADGYHLSIDMPSSEKGKTDEIVNKKCELHFCNHYAAGLKNFFDFTVVKQFGFDRPIENQTDARSNGEPNRQNENATNTRSNGKPNRQVENATEARGSGKPNRQVENATETRGNGKPNRRKNNRKGKGNGKEGKSAKDDNEDTKKPELKIENLDDW